MVYTIGSHDDYRFRDIPIYRSSFSFEPGVWRKNFQKSRRSRMATHTEESEAYSNPIAPKTSHDSQHKAYNVLDPEPYRPPPPTLRHPEKHEQLDHERKPLKPHVAIDIDRRTDSFSGSLKSTSSMMSSTDGKMGPKDKDDVKKEEIVEDLVKLLNRMMNPQQGYTAMFGALCGFYATIAGAIFLHNIRDTQVLIRELFVILIVYGIIEIVLAFTFILSLCQTKMALTKGLNKGFQIICGLTTVFLYLMIVALAAIVGIVGFYKSVYLYSRVDYHNPESVYFLSKTSYRSTVILFTIHIFSVMLKCCYCR